MPVNKVMAEKSPGSSPFWAPHVHADRRPALLARGRIVAALRSWFAGQGFVEVETGALQVSPGNETHLHAFATSLTAPDGSGSRLYLRTSPEFACKKLLAAGERRIVEFAKVFRNRERGALHHPEFTLVEWYRAEEPYQKLTEDCDGTAGRGGQRGRCDAIQFPRSHCRSIRGAGASHGRRCVCEIRGHRSVGDTAGWKTRPRTARECSASLQHPHRRR